MNQRRVLRLLFPAGAAALLLVAVTLTLPAAANRKRDLPRSLQAAPSVVINEVAWGGTAAPLGHNDEWIELYNSSAVSVDLTGCNKNIRTHAASWKSPAIPGEFRVMGVAVSVPHFRTCGG